MFSLNLKTKGFEFVLAVAINHWILKMCTVNNTMKYGHSQIIYMKNTFHSYRLIPLRKSENRSNVC